MTWLPREINILFSHLKAIYEGNEKINEKGIKTIMEIFVHKRNMSAVTIVRPVSDRMSHNAQQSLV
jgi:hypothetical protein